MSKRRAICFFVLLLTSVMNCAIAQDVAPGPSDAERRLSKLVFNLLERMHARSPVEPSVIAYDSIRLFVDNVDPARIYFLDGDVTGMQRKSREWADGFASGDFSLPMEMVRLFHRRVDERVAHCLRRLEGPERAGVVSGLKSVQYGKRAISAAELEERWSHLLTEDLRHMSGDVAGLATRYRTMQSQVRSMTADEFADRALDSWTRGYDAYTWLQFQPGGKNPLESPSVRSTGFSFDVSGGFAVVTFLNAGNALKRRHAIRKDDLIVAIGSEENDLTPIVGLSKNEIAKRLQAEAGRDVVVRLLRTGTSTLSTVTLAGGPPALYDAVSANVVQVEALSEQHEIAVIRIANLYLDFEARARGDKNYKSTARDIKDTLAKLPLPKLSGMVLDLRDNGGGALLEAVAVAELFLGAAPVLAVNEVSARRIETLDAKEPPLYSGPLVVLVDENTASGAELIATGLRDNDRALLIGTRTFAHGYIASAVPLSRYVVQDADVRGAMLIITMGYAHRPNGEPIGGQGVVPDIVLSEPLTPIESTAPIAPIKSLDRRLSNRKVSELGKRIGKGIENTAGNDWQACKRNTDAARNPTGDANDPWVQCAARVLAEMKRYQDQK